MINPDLITLAPEVRFRRLHKDARLPEYAHGAEDAGMDLFFLGEPDPVTGDLMSVWLDEGCRLALSTGLAIELPPRHEGQVRSRSGLALKKGLVVLNAPGTIDPGYRGELKVILHNTGRSSCLIEPGDKIAQLVIAPVVHAIVREVDSLTASDRGEAGFGSTGR